MHVSTGHRPALPALTGLRFLAAAQVVLFHARSMIPGLRTDPALNMLGSGYSGVSLFFVLSGFVLAYNYLTPDGRGVASVRDFMVARLARIYPAYLLGIAVALPVFVRDLTAISGPTHYVRDGWKPLTMALLLLQAWVPSYACRVNCPGWSLSAEAFFYALFPLLGYWMARRRTSALLLIAVACWLSAMAAAWGYVLRNPDRLGVTSAASYATWLSALKFNPLIRLPEFVLGMAAALVFLRAPRALERYAGWATVATLAAILTALALHNRLPYPMLHNGLLAPLYALLIVALAVSDGPIATVLGSRPLRLLGEASFALYLLHVPVLIYTQQALAKPSGALADAPLGFLCTYLLAVQALAILAQKVVEEPVRRAIRSRFGRNSGRHPAARAGQDWRPDEPDQSLLGPTGRPDAA